MRVYNWKATSYRQSLNHSQSRCCPRGTFYERERGEEKSFGECVYVCGYTPARARACVCACVHEKRERERERDHWEGVNQQNKI